MASSSEHGELLSGLSPFPARSRSFIVTAVAFLGLSAATWAGPSEHWSFQPLHPVVPPAVHNAAWTRNGIDRFILAGLEAAALKPAPPASGELLLRRVFIDLIGLPPTPAQLDAFLQNPSVRAYEETIDRLLASPHYGERWARHWLDLARYAESDGFEHDAVRPHTWRYRDYVINSFNNDKPYDRFILEQLAGDELWPDQPDALVATGFNLLGPDMVDSSDQIQRRLNTLNDMTDTAASVFLGLTLSCARCHDHKFEPFTQKDYFAFEAFFVPAEFRREQPMAPTTERTAHRRAMDEYNAHSAAVRKQIADIEAPYRQRLFEEKLARLSEDAQTAHRTPKERRTAEQEATVQETLSQVKVGEEEVSLALAPADLERRGACEAALKKIVKPPPLPLTMGLQDTYGPPPPTCVLFRGDYNQPREEVEPDIPAVLSTAQPFSSMTERFRRSRSALAQWIASPANPLTARVIVNRVWQHHFGRALVATPNDFGTHGESPTHPELLDWLAGELIRSGWSLKQMHKLILLSAAYQQSSTADAETRARDPNNRFYSRQNPLRLEGEVIRDSLLAISGCLNPEIGGPGVMPPLPAGLAKNAKDWKDNGNPMDHNRRSIYVFARRNLRFPFFELFDAPDTNLTCPERGHSTTAPQSLTLLNSDEVLHAAEATATRIGRETTEGNLQIERAYRLILSRRPTGPEFTQSVAFLRKAPLSELCRALFNLNAFVYAE